MKARTYCALPSTPDHWALRCMNKCSDRAVSPKQDAQCLSPQASLILVYRATARDSSEKQLGANHLDKLCAHEPIADAAIDGRALTSPSVVHWQFFELFGSRRSTASKLASLWNCSAAHELILRNRKILLLEGR
ncbi:hypothetical protein TNCV_621071 [Trichonephila clavipes]|nr:hypothetical protein TNCV_621071 [Trichonephila clavipes]